MLSTSAATRAPRGRPFGQLITSGTRRLVWYMKLCSHSAVVAELLAVVGGDDHERVVEHAAPLELRQHLADHVVGLA